MDNDLSTIKLNGIEAEYFILSMVRTDLTDSEFLEFDKFVRKYLSGA
jgi:hypothetical protein